VREPPSGTVTFLFTDIEGSTRLWEEQHDGMAAALARHDDLLREVVSGHRGYLVKSTGDGSLAAFADAHDALRAAATAQLELAATDWNVTGPLLVRMAVHTGSATERNGDYFGPVLNRAARLLAIGHGGQVLVSNATASIAGDVLDDGARLIALGEHRLRDLSRPELVFQLVVPGLIREFPAPRSLDTVRTNLPERLTSFVGRDRELRDLGKLLQTHRLVTVTGVGGVGKTRLALHLAADASSRYIDGTWVCELAAVEDEDSMVEVLAATMGVAARSGLSLAESIGEFLWAKQVLLVIDNCEHLLDAVAGIVGAILRDCPRASVLATSREGLGLDGEQLWPLRSLAMPPLGAPGDEVATSDAVMLFVDRAQGADPRFALDPGNAVAVAEICRRLDGIPLAIELAAARTAALSPGDVAALLDERFRLLTRGRRGAVDRHQTLRATVDWSYSLLSENERLLFDRLGVFPGSFDAPAAQSVAVGDGVDGFAVIELLTELVAKSMLVADRSGDGPMRYQLLETIRDYAMEHLGALGETDNLRRRHANHYAEIAEQIGPGLLSRDELVWRARELLELDNLRAAVDWALESGGDEELAFRVIAALATEATSHRAAGIGGWAERAARTSALDASLCRSWVLSVAAYGAFHRGDLTATEAYVRSIPREATQAWVYAVAALGNVVASRGDVGAALEIYRGAIEALGAGDEWAYPSCWVRAVRGIFASTAGDTDLARAETEAGLRAARRLGQPSALALALYASSMAMMETDPEAALAAAEESIDLLGSAGASDVVYSGAVLVVSLLRERAGDSLGAAIAAREAIAHSDEIGDRAWIHAPLTSALRLIGSAGDAEGAAVIAGALLDGWFHELVFTLEADVSSRDEALRSAAATLGPGPYEAARARGAAMPYEEVIAYVLAELDRTFPVP
jgi:predicted ATPase/class 3 adenylate cyclase